MSKSGEIKNWNHDKGFGFISGDDGEDCFCHATSFVDSQDSKGIGKGDRVRFDMEFNDRNGKERAVNVTLKSGGGGGGGGRGGRRRDDSRDRGRGGRDDRGRGGRDDRDGRSQRYRSGSRSRSPPRRR
mmetsp:Transcript_125808/g.204362  ORF Transcript_125808/g.204362 Transcript_125808/m.204362 type:complete len:128 (-) Transcript_125808:84-467(-)